MTSFKSFLPILAVTVATASTSYVLNRCEAQTAKSQTASALIAVLHSDASLFDKVRACQKAAALGDKTLVSALAPLLADEKLASNARSAQESISDPSAGAALKGKEAEGKPGKTLTSNVKAASKEVSLFDGHTFTGWEGDTEKSFRIQDGAIVGGSLKQPVPRNEFLCTKASYGNFILRAECKLIGPGNGGIQIRTERIPNNNEVSGFQADFSAGANGGYWGSLYDESRRNKTLAKPDRAVIMKALKPNDWNLYEIRCEGPHIRLLLNGVQTVDYTETDPKIATTGIIAVQIHASNKPSETWYRNIMIEELK